MDAKPMRRETNVGAIGIPCQDPPARTDRFVTWAVCAGLAAAVLGLLLRGLVAPALAIPFGVAACLVLARRPELGFYALVFLMPFETLRGGAAKGLGVALAAILVADAALRRRPIFDPRSTLVGAAGAFFAVAVVSAIASPYFPYSLAGIRQLGIAGLFFALTLALLTRDGLLRVAPRVIVWSTGLSAALAVADYIVDLPRLNLAFQEDYLKRSVGFFLNPNHFASALIFGLPFAAHEALWGRGPWRKAAAAGTAVLALAALVLTYSRGAALVGGIVLLLLGFHYRDRLGLRRRLVLVPVALLSVAVAVSVVPSAYWARLASMREGEGDSSISRRLSYLRVGLDAARQRPLVGLGPGMFHRAYGESRFAAMYADSEEDLYRDAHNTYFEILVGTGALGLAAMAAVVACAVRRYLRAVRCFRAGGDPAAADTAFAYLVSFLSVILYFLMLSRPHSKHFWMGLAISEVAMRAARSASGRES